MVYMGSKRLYVKYICPILQKTIDENNIENFYDVCVGGAHIIENIKCKKKIGIDLNKDLIDLYNYGLTKNIYPDKITREDWDKAKKGEGESWWRALVCFFASTSARGFSGGYCLNGERDFYHERLRNFQKQLLLIKDCEFIYGDVLIYPFIENSVIYIDPPYKNTKKYDINKNFNYEKFWERVRELSLNNFVFVSEQEAPEDFISIWSKEVKRHCFNAGKGGASATENLWIYRVG